MKNSRSLWGLIGCLWLLSACAGSQTLHSTQALRSTTVTATVTAAPAREVAPSTVMPTMTATPYPVVAATATRTPETVTPTARWTMTATPRAASATPPAIGTQTLTRTPDSMPAGAAEICGIGRVAPPRPDGEALYFQPFQQDWYRTRDEFATYEWVAPAGILAPDLKTRVVFNCAGAGSICVATPPQTEPVPLPLHYEPRDGIFHDDTVAWLPDHQRLIFSVTYPPWEKRDEPPDWRLYLLDLRGPQLQQITPSRAAYPTWALSPLGTCVAYIDKRDGEEGFRFHLTDLEPDGGFADWSMPIEGLSETEEFPVALAWSPDGRRLASIFWAAPFNLVVWDLATNVRIDYARMPHGLTVLQWAPVGDTMFLIGTSPQGGSSDWVLNVQTGQLRELGGAHAAGWRSSYQWLPDGKRIIMPGLSKSVSLDTTDGTLRKLEYPGPDITLIKMMFFAPPAP